MDDFYCLSTKVDLYMISKIPLLTLAFVSDSEHQDVLARFGKGRREELVN